MPYKLDKSGKFVQLIGQQACSTHSRHPRIPLLDNLFDKAKTSTITGVIERISRRIQENSEGYVLLIEGVPGYFWVLDAAGQPLTATPVGLAVAGDQVSFDAEDNGKVQLRTFRNLTLEKRDEELSHAERRT